MTTLRSDLAEVLRNVRDAQHHIGVAWGVRDSDGFAEHMMDCVNDLTLALDYLGDAMEKVPTDDGTPPASPTEISELTSALSAKGRHR